jgi:hypothetical protein
MKVTAFWDIWCAISLKYNDVLEMCTATIVRATNRKSENSVYFNEITRSYIQEGCRLILAALRT